MVFSGCRPHPFPVSGLMMQATELSQFLEFPHGFTEYSETIVADNQKLTHVTSPGTHQGNFRLPNPSQNSLVPYKMACTPLSGMAYLCMQTSCFLETKTLLPVVYVSVGLSAAILDLTQ